MAPSQTVWMSDVQGETAIGSTRASSGPQTGFSFSIYPTLPIPSIAKPFMIKILLYYKKFLDLIQIPDYFCAAIITFPLWSVKQNLVKFMTKT